MLNAFLQGEFCTTSNYGLDEAAKLLELRNQVSDLQFRMLLIHLYRVMDTAAMLGMETLRNQTLDLHQSMSLTNKTIGLSQVSGPSIHCSLHLSLVFSLVCGRFQRHNGLTGAKI